MGAAIALSLLFGAAVAASLPGIDLFVTPDEDNWMRRTGNFARAIELGRFDRTFQSGHPGVTTMWIARLALGPEASQLAGVTGPDSMVTQLPSFMAKLVRARVAFVLVNAAIVVGLTLLVWRLFGPGPAALAGPLLALDPFMAAHGQVVHLDALSAGLITLAALAGVAYWWVGGGPGYLALCGVATGLAVLTKAPSLFLGLFLPAIAIWAGFAGAWERGWRPLLLSIVGCGALALGVVFLLWPALWVAPLETIARSIEFQFKQASAPHLPGNFFRGQPTADPGPLFYPVALAFRLTPLALLGLTLLAIFLPPPHLRRQTVLLVDLALGFLVFLTIASKKLDRYALPLFPSLSILAAVGLWVAWLRIRPKVTPRMLTAGLALFTLGQALPLLTVAPYLLAYYNPLLGGGQAAKRVLLVGWGEGLDQAAAYLNAQPGAAASRIAVYFPMVRNFQGMVAGTVQRYGVNEPADYVVDYVNAAQRRQSPAEVWGRPADHTVVINGIEYARVYRFSPPRVVGNP